jgi:hypothetical protein
MDFAQKAYDHLAVRQLDWPGVTLGRAMHREVLQVNGKIFAFLKDGKLVVKLPAAQALGLLQDGTAVPFEAGGRAMKEWVAVPLPVPDGERAWSHLMSEARTYVAGSPAEPD